jgi:protoporphyrinogen oxidase
MMGKKLNIDSIRNESNDLSNSDFLIIGAGFSGLTLGYRLAQAGKSVIILEADSEVGGLAAEFKLSNGLALERFYHHWFKSDTAINKLVNDLGLSTELREYPSNTGMYLNRRIWKLSTPLDLIRFKAISLSSRMRLGFATLLVRRVTNWKEIEGLTIREWLEPLCGREAYSVVWEPLIKAKFSIFSEEVSAAWMWKKLVLRGSTRSKNGAESLLYLDGGFGRLSRELEVSINAAGGHIKLGEKVSRITHDDKRVIEVITDTNNLYAAGEVIFTGAPSQLSKLIESNKNNDWLQKLSSIKYLGNICLVLLMDRSLSETYWLNVNDPGFPFVGVIEHTNLVSSSQYGDLHVIYLSRYIAVQDPTYSLSDEDYFQSCIEPLSKMFPHFEVAWIKEHYVWRTAYAQPITTKNYSEVVPAVQTPFSNLSLNSMAQVYPEDRGTNYAVQNAENLARKFLEREK